MDWKKLGLTVGLEIHWELDTKNKLFCNCPTILRNDEPDVVIERYMRPVAGELGDIDIAAEFEAIKKKKIIYQAYSDATCLVETDSEPPHNPNEDAVRIALMISLMLNAKPVDEIHVMRKTIIDGSNTSGFQRTMLVARDGFVDVSFGKIGINTISLEEDSARIIENKPDKIVFRLDRLGIPEVEIGTDPDIHTPEQALEVAEKIGQVLMSTGKVKTGLGVVRQDVNVSIEGGNRIEIKHVQRLGQIPEVIKNEVKRQLALIEIRDKIKRRKIKKEFLSEKFVDVSKVFENTQSKVISSGNVFAVRLPKFAGILGEEILTGIRFGSEIADIVRVKTGLKGIIHTDELPGYGISEEEVKKLRNFVKAKNEDCVVIVVGEREKSLQALKEVVNRIKQAFDGVPREVRVANPDGTTSFLRPLAGAARMYPETDIEPIKVDKKVLNEIKKQLPESWDKKLNRFKKELKLSDELAEQIIKSEYLSIFEKIVEKIKVDPTLIATTFVYTLKDLKRKGISVENFTNRHFNELFELIRQKKLAKEGILIVLEKLGEIPDKSVLDAVKELKLLAMSKSELRQLVKEKIKVNRNRLRDKDTAYKFLMGIVMGEVRGRIDGKIVDKVVREEIEKLFRL